MNKKSMKAVFIFMFTIMANMVMAQTNVKVDTGIFPKAGKNQKKVVIEVPHSKEDSNKKIEIFVGKDMETDKCNQYRLPGEFTQSELKGWGYQYLVFTSNGNASATMKACPETGTKTQFVYSSASYLADYNGRMPIVLYVPEGYSVKYKIYKADPEEYDALEVQEKK
ncbi:MAG: ecotin family protein [Bergeyella sp.]